MLFSSLYSTNVEHQRICILLSVDLRSRNLDFSQKDGFILYKNHKMVII